MKMKTSSAFLVLSVLSLPALMNCTFAQESQPNMGADEIYRALMGKQYNVTYTNGGPETQTLIMERGAKGSPRPIGVIGDKGRIVFTTDYISVDPRIMSQFAQVLHTFMVLHHGGWENFQKFNSRPMIKMDNGELIRPMPDAFKASHVSYDDMFTLGQDWWKTNSEVYRKEAGPLKDRFIYEAVLDAIRNYGYVELWTGAKPNTDHVQWIDIVVKDAASKS